MPQDKSNEPRRYRLRTSAGPLIALALVFALPARGQEDADLDLKPADFSPDERVAIRVDGLQPGRQGSDVAVTVANRLERRVDATVECTLADADREDLGVVTAPAVEIGAGERRSMTVTGAAGATHAYCRVRDAK